MKRHLLICGFLALSHAPAGSAAEPPPKRPQEAQVTIAGDYDIYSVSEGYGFVVIVKGWEPKVPAEIQMVGPKGEILNVVPGDRPLRANGNGRMVVYIPYKLHGLYEGTWQLLISSKNGIHEVGIEIPAKADQE